ncbi:TIR domain-containing protein [Verrucomicrobia bacterium]|nr:TIR domain-containing protein [Verrucomicrobiota bacterium]
MPEEIFISYSRKDSDRVMPLVKQLREDGYSVWLDDSHIESASLWAEQIVEGLKNCKVLMLMCSKDSLASKNVLKEVMLASELEKTLLPVYLEECELPSRFQYQLAGIQHIDLFKASDKQPVEQLSDALDSTNLVKLGDVVQLSDQIQSPKSGHKFILNKWKYIISGIVGYITILLGVMFMAMEKFDMVFIMEEFTFPFLISIFLVTFGALFFSYRSSAFKPWLVPFGYKVPEEEEIIRKYVQICISAKNILVTIALILIIVGIPTGIAVAYYKDQDVSPYYAPSNLIANGADVNYVTADGWAPLHFAATHDAKMINLLIKNGADINVKTYAYKWTPLHIASGRLGGVEIVKALVSAGADINTKTSKLDGKFGEQASNAIDDNPSTKYLNFDKLDTGLTIATGGGVVTGLALTSASDAPDRDPANFILSGSNDDGVTFTEIASGDVPEFLKRLERQTVSFDNDIAYTTYELIFPKTVGPSGCCMQIAEIELLAGSQEAGGDKSEENEAPDKLGDITLPGDQVVPTSDNSPGKGVWRQSVYRGYANSGYENIVTGINNDVYVQVDPEKEITALDVAMILENTEIENFLKSAGGRTGEQLSQ